MGQKARELASWHHHDDMTVTTQPSFAWQLFIYAACQSPLIRRSVRFNCRQMAGKRPCRQENHDEERESSRAFAFGLAICHVHLIFAGPWLPCLKKQFAFVCPACLLQLALISLCKKFSHCNYRQPTSNATTPGSQAEPAEPAVCL